MRLTHYQAWLTAPVNWRVSHLVCDLPALSSLSVLITALGVCWYPRIQDGHPIRYGGAQTCRNFHGDCDLAHFMFRPERTGRRLRLMECRWRIERCVRSLSSLILALMQFRLQQKNAKIRSAICRAA